MAKTRALVASIIGLCSSVCIAMDGDMEMDELMSLSLTELMSIPVNEVGALTYTSLKNTPAAVTRIKAQDIKASGARSLYELLDIYVPNMQWIRHNWESNHMGARGITGDREDKVMIRVNGRVMNERTHFGAISERDFPMMADIQFIDVIRGAGSSLYGLGAVSMVIDIKTHTANSRPGSGLVARAGAQYRFASLEGYHSSTIMDGVGLYLYGAIGRVDGADEKDSPIVFGTDYTAQSGGYVNAGSAYPGPEANDGAQYNDKNPVKLHMQLSTDNSELWMRYTRAGERQVRDLGLLATSPPGWGPFVQEDYVEIGYQQFTATYEHQYQWSPDLSIKSMFSFDTLDYQRYLPFDPGFFAENYREDEWFAKSIATWQLNDAHQVAFGGEFSHEKFGLKAHRGSDDVSITGDLDSWDTNTASLVGEWQWQLAKDWISFLGGRVDKNRFSDTLYSPRASLIWSMTDLDVMKFLLTRSQRMNFAEQNRSQYLMNQDNGGAETLDSLEVRYERIEHNTHLAISTFYLELDAIGWNGSAAQSELIGTQKQWGVEFELERKLANYTLRFSHAYTKLLDFNLEADTTVITAEPFGYGDDIADWSNHITKLVASYQATDRLQLDSSLRVYWGFPGSQDFRDKYIDENTDRVDASWDDGYGQQIFFNASGQYTVSDASQVGLYFYNMLGWADKDYNKRNYRDSWGNYRSEAAAVAVSYSIKL